MSAESEINGLANYIMAEISNEPSQSQGAGGTAMRILQKYRSAFEDIMDELGVPDDGYPMNIANAYEIAEKALE